MIKKEIGQMKQLMTRVALLAAVVMVVASTGFSQNIKIGYYDEIKIASGYKAWVKANETFVIEQEAWEKEAVSKQQELDSLYKEYEKQRLILSDEKRKEREAALRAKRESYDAYTQQVFGNGGTAQRKEAELLKPISEAVNKAVEAVALEEGYDIIFTLRGGIGYIRPSLDVTSKVLAKLDKLEQ
jgi:outer membrane protein